MRLGKSRLDDQCLTVRDRRLGQPALCLEDVSEVEIRLGVIRLVSRRPLIGGRRLGKLTTCLQGDARLKWA